MMDLLKKYLSRWMQTMMGWLTWHMMCKRNDLSDKLIILFPDANYDNNMVALSLINDLLVSRNMQKAFIITHDQRIRVDYSFYSNKRIKVKVTKKNKVNYLLQYYKVSNFDSRFLVASIDQPFGRNGKLFMRNTKAGLKDFYAIGVFDISPYKTEGFV